MHYPIPQSLPDLPPTTGSPWPAEIVQAHHGLHAAFKASRTALNLDESDPIRLGHHLQQVKTFMVSVFEALGRQENNPLPPTYIKQVGDAILGLVSGLQSALTKATAMYVVILI